MSKKNKLLFILHEFLYFQDVFHLLENILNRRA